MIAWEWKYPRGLLPPQNPTPPHMVFVNPYHFCLVNFNGISFYCCHCQTFSDIITNQSNIEITSNYTDTRPTTIYKRKSYQKIYSIACFCVKLSWNDACIPTEGHYLVYISISYTMTWLPHQMKTSDSSFVEFFKQVFVQSEQSFGGGWNLIHIWLGIL